MGKYYNIRDLIDKHPNAKMYWVISGRGNGKSLQALKKCVDDYIADSKQFIILRRYSTEVKPVKKTLFDNFTALGWYADHEMIVKGDQIYIDGEVAGFIYSLSQVQRLKSVAYPNVYNVLFDEILMLRTSVSHYIQEEVTLFLSYMDTVFRGRQDGCIMCLSNTISQSNPYFEYFKFPVLDPGTTTVINDGKVIIDYPLSQELQDDRKNNSLIGDIAKGTEYASYSFDSKMVGDSEAFILEERPNTKRLHGIIKIAGKVFFVWECKDDIYWITDKGKIPNGFKYKFAVRNDDMEMGYRPYNYRMDGLHAATFAFVDNKLFFANQMCKQRWYEFIL